MLLDDPSSATPTPTASGIGSYWSLNRGDLLQRLDAADDGLSTGEARERLRQFGKNELERGGDLAVARVLWNQVRSPLLLLLLFAASVSAASGEWVDAGIVGAMSSVFDLLTFAGLLWIFEAAPALFRTGWFVESLLTELAIALVVRTRRPFFRSRPGRALLVSTALLAPVALAIPFVPGAALLGFVPLPLGMLATVAGVTVLYVIAAELTKTWFYRTIERER